MLALITATKNSMRTVRDALESAAPFRHEIKHYLIDAASSDGTREYLASFVTIGNGVLLSQTGTGLYPALNQAVTAALADPEITHIGFLHSDDRFISAQFDQYLCHINSSQCDFFYSDIEYHDKHDRCFRVWNAGRFSMFKLKTGWMPPHTSVVVAKRIYRDFGIYDPAFGTAADYEWIVRVLSSNNASVSYYPQRTLSMLAGGASGATLAARLRANAMDGKAWADGSLARSLLIRVTKPLRKVLQFRAFP
jgi:glycosyltransferase involved in cell wall biosynthesis